MWILSKHTNLLLVHTMKYFKENKILIVINQNDTRTLIKKSIFCKFCIESSHYEYDFYEKILYFFPLRIRLNELWRQMNRNQRTAFYEVKQHLWACLQSYYIMLWLYGDIQNVILWIVCQKDFQINLRFFYIKCSFNCLFKNLCRSVYNTFHLIHLVS